MADFTAIRNKSLTKARTLGYPVNEALPLLDQPAITRSPNAIVDRVLSMLCVAASAYGFNNQLARAWLSRETDVGSLTKYEQDYLHTQTGDSRLFKEQVEGMWALAWSIGTVPNIDYGQPCAQEFVSHLPDLKANKCSTSFRSNAILRPDAEIVAACDLAYCLHWAVKDAQLKGEMIPGNVEEYIVVERRRALEWLLTDANWEDVMLDT